VMYVEVNNARFWVEDVGDGPALLFLHFGLGDHRVFDPELHALADEFRCVAYDRRFFGRTEAPEEPYSEVQDAIALLDASGSSEPRSSACRAAASSRSTSPSRIRSVSGRSRTSPRPFPASRGATSSRRHTQVPTRPSRRWKPT
jgi:hypothetical protein